MKQKQDFTLTFLACYLSINSLILNTTAAPNNRMNFCCRYSILMKFLYFLFFGLCVYVKHLMRIRETTAYEWMKLLIYKYFTEDRKDNASSATIYTHDKIRFVFVFSPSRTCGRCQGSYNRWAMYDWQRQSQHHSDDSRYRGM